MVAVVLTLVWCSSARAQAPAAKGDGAPAAAPAPAAAASAAPAETTSAKKTVRRLPPYYGKVVTDKQREAIYAIQAKFNDEIAKLQAQLESLTAKRDAEIAQTLTDEQREEITRLKSERKTRRATSTSDDDPATDG
jgi:predicted house-cleaning noncanonical NTP pyrophosphatase (MazG superfamily)